MRKLSALVLFAIILFIAGCSRTNTPAMTGANQWTENGKVYKVSGDDGGSGLGFEFFGTSGLTCTITYETGIPTSSGSYLITESSISGLQIHVEDSTGNTMTNHNTNVYATVTVSNGKVTTSIPQIWVYGLPPRTSDSLLFTANLIQQ